MVRSTIEYSHQEHVGIIRLNRPERMNAVTELMYQEIQDVLKQVKEDSGIRSLILTGSVLKRGEKEKQAFCAGADLKEHHSGKRSKAQQKQYLTLAHDTTRMFYTFPKPIIAAINGPARGAGAEMALNCDFIVMANDATIAFPEISLGTFIGGGSSYLLVKYIGMIKAKELVYTGRILNGKEAVDIGLAFRSLPLDELFPWSIEFAISLSEKAPISLTLAKRFLQQTETNIETILEHETDAILSCMETSDWHEGIRAFLEKRKPIFKGE